MDFFLVLFHYTISLFKNNRSYDEIDNLIFINVNKDNGFDEKDLEETEKRIGRIPEVLREYYIKLGKIQNLNNSQDRLLNPDEIKDLGEYIEFYMEKQYVCRWCIAKMERNSFNSCFFL